MLTRDDVQHISDMRLIALAKIKLWDGSPRYSGPRIVMRDIIKQLDALLLSGPAEFRCLVEPTATLEQIQRDLHLSVFGRPPA